MLAPRLLICSYAHEFMHNNYVCRFKLLYSQAKNVHICSSVSMFMQMFILYVHELICMLKFFIVLLAAYVHVLSSVFIINRSVHRCAKSIQLAVRYWTVRTMSNSISMILGDVTSRASSINSRASAFTLCMCK